MVLIQTCCVSLKQSHRVTNLLAVFSSAMQCANHSRPTLTSFLRHGYTYSGHASACVAALVNLAIIEREGLRDRATVIGKRIGDALKALAQDGVIDHARGDGAVWAAGLHASQNNVKIRDRMLELGAITRAINADTNTSAHRCHHRLATRQTARHLRQSRLRQISLAQIVARKRLFYFLG